jgi:DNA-binding transcriptional ArsR family regulator
VDSWTALADPSRREIFIRLLDHPTSVTELADHLPISRPAVSQHLRVLLEARLVTVTPEGTRRIYRPDPAGLDAFRSEVEVFWSRALTTFKQIVESDDRPDTARTAHTEKEHPR